MSPPNRATAYPGSFRQMSERVKAAAVRKVQREQAEAVQGMPASHQRHTLSHEPLLARNPFTNAPDPDSSLVSSHKFTAINERAVDLGCEDATEEDTDQSASRIEETSTTINEMSPTSSDEDDLNDFTYTTRPRANTSDDEPRQSIRTIRPSAVKRPPGNGSKVQQKHSKPASRHVSRGTSSNESSSSLEMPSTRGQDRGVTESKPLTPFDISRLEPEDEQRRRNNRRKARQAFWEDFWTERGR